nr:hypothetical protein [Streptacidiphilus pinicola]
MNGLVDGAFDAGAAAVALPPSGGLLLGALLLEQFMLLARVQGEAAGEAADAQLAVLSSITLVRFEAPA